MSIEACGHVAVQQHLSATAARGTPSPSSTLLPFPSPPLGSHAGALMRIVGRQTFTTCAAGRSQFSPRRCTYNNCPVAGVEPTLSSVGVAEARAGAGGTQCATLAH
ncbi:hypothetical protein ACLKA6_018960 [Drosophila palustris]